MESAGDNPENPHDGAPPASPNPKDRGTKVKDPVSLLRTLVIFQAVSMLILLAALGCLAAVIVYHARDTELRDQVLVSKSTGEPVRVFSADFTVTPTGVLVSRDTSKSDPQNFRKAGNGTAAKIMTTSDATLPYVTVSTTDSGSGGSAGRRRTLLEELTYTPTEEFADEREAAAAASSDGVEGRPGGASGVSVLGPHPGHQATRRSLQQQPANSSGAPSDVPQDSVPLMTAQSNTAMGLHSGLPMSVLKELKYVQVNASSGAQLNLMVLAIAKMPTPFEEGLYMSCEVLKIVTYIGTITIHGSVMEFGHESVTNVFKEAGFLVTGTRRRQMIAGVYDLIGFFNFIKDLEIENLPPSEPKPHIATNFQMKVRVYESCINKQDPNSDRCRGSDGTILPGSVIDGAARFMTTYMTVSRQNGRSLTTTEFPNYGPALVRKELVNEDTGISYEWQDLLQGTRVTHCQRLNMAADEMGMFQNLTKDSVVSFQFMGYGLKLGVATRQFRLVTRQPILRGDFGGGEITDGTFPKMYEIKNVEMDYWDTAENGDLCSIGRNNYPVAFEMDHPVAGITKMHIVSFIAGMTLPNSTFNLPEHFDDTEGPQGCPGPRHTQVPKISSPYDPAWQPPSKDNLDSLFRVVDTITATERNPDVAQGVVQAADALSKQPPPPAPPVPTPSQQPLQQPSAPNPGRRRVISVDEVQTSFDRPGELLVPQDQLQKIMDDIFRFHEYHVEHMNASSLSRAANGRMLQQGFSYSKNISVCRLTLKSNTASGNAQFAFNCNGNIPEFHPISVSGDLTASLTYRPKLSVGVDGCLSLSVDVEEILRKYTSSIIATAARKVGLAQVVKIGGMCLSYDYGKNLGVLTVNSKMPNSKFVWAEWNIRMETNFKDCFAPDNSYVRAFYKLNLLFIKKTSTAFDINLFRGQGCPAAALQPSGTRTVRIRSASGKCVDIPGGNQYSGNRLALADCNSDTNAQMFSMEPAENNYIFRATEGKVIEAEGSSISEGTKIQLWEYSQGNAQQQWRAEKAATAGNYRLRNNLLPDLCMGPSPSDNNLQLVACDAINSTGHFALADW